MANIKHLLNYQFLSAYILQLQGLHANRYYQARFCINFLTLHHVLTHKAHSFQVRPRKSAPYGYRQPEAF